MTTGTQDLQVALEAEYAAVFAWGLIGAQTTEDRRALARAALARHEAARTWLRQQYVDAGQTAPAAAAAYDTGRVTDPGAAAALAMRVELACVPAWSKVAASGDAAQRAYAAAQAQADAVRAMAWGAGSSAFPGASGAGAGQSTSAAAAPSAETSVEQPAPTSTPDQTASTGSEAAVPDLGATDPTDAAG